MLVTNPDFPVGNGACMCKTTGDVKSLAVSAADFIVVGGYTPKERAGNPGNTFNGDSAQGLNSRGLPCGGIPYLDAHGKEMVETAHKAGKKIILNINGFTPRDYYDLTIAAVAAGFDGVEVNTACPNIVDGAARKPIFFFDLALSHHLIGAVSSALPEHMFMLVKVSVSSDPEYIVRYAQMLQPFGVYGVVATNTFANCLLYRSDRKPQIDTPDKTGWAGGSGHMLKAIALGQVNQWRHTLPKATQVIGAGGVACHPSGISYGFDVMDMLHAGASAVQVSTAYAIHGPKIFGEIASQYLDQLN